MHPVYICVVDSFSWPACLFLKSERSIISPCQPLCPQREASVRYGAQLYSHLRPSFNSSLHLHIHQYFVSCQLVDGTKLQYQILIDIHQVHHKQPNTVVPKLCALINRQFRQRTYHQPAAADHHEAYLHRETLTKRTYLGFSIFILPIVL